MMSDAPRQAYSPFEWPEYAFYSSLPPQFHPEHVGVRPDGARWGLWPLYFEEYRSDEEPVLTDSDPTGTAPNRLILWQRPFRTDVPVGWHYSPFEKAGVCIGYHDNLREDYVQRWNHRTRNYLSRWKTRHLGTDYMIEDISYEEFAAAYARSTVAKEVPRHELTKLQLRLHLFPDSVHMWGVRRHSDAVVVAGITTFDSTLNKASHYGMGFYQRLGNHDPVMIGLMDYWFAHSLKAGLKVLHFGIFLKPEDSGSKRAHSISLFKAQFITDYLVYQRPLYRFVKGKLFRRSVV